MARPRKKINKKQFENLCRLQCTKDEICGVLDVGEKTLTKWCEENYGVGFYEVFKEKRQMGRASLRRNQFKLSERNVAMAIWLGKQWLGQTDQPVNQENTERDNSLENVLKKLAEKLNG